MPATVVQLDRTTRLIRRIASAEARRDWPVVEALAPSVLQVRPDCGPVRRALVSAYLERASECAEFDEHERALRICDEALMLEPDHVEARNRRVSALCALERWEDAAEELTRVLEAAPRDAGAYALRGNCHQHLGDKARARADYERACALRQHDLDLRMARCRMHAFFESWDELLGDVRPLVSSALHKEEARTLRAVARTRLHAAGSPAPDDEDDDGFMADGPRAVLARIDAMIMRARSGRGPDAFPFYELQDAAEACKEAMQRFPEQAEALKSALNRALVGAAGHAAWDWPGEHALDSLAWWIESESSVLSDPFIFGHLASAYVQQADEVCVLVNARRRSLQRALHYMSLAVSVSKGKPRFYDARASIHESLGNRFCAWLDRRRARKHETKRLPPPDDAIHGEAN